MMYLQGVRVGLASQCQSSDAVSGSSDFLLPPGAVSLCNLSCSFAADRLLSCYGVGGS